MQLQPSLDDWVKDRLYINANHVVSFKQAGHMIYIQTIKNEITCGPFDAEYLHAHAIETLSDAVFKSPHQLIYVYRYNNKWHLESTDFDKSVPPSNQIIWCQQTDDVIDKLIRNIYIILALLTVFIAWIYAGSSVSAP